MTVSSSLTAATSSQKDLRSRLDHQGRVTMTTTLPSPHAGLRAWRQRGFGRLVLTEKGIFVPLIFTAGVFIVIEPGTWLYQIARVSPMGAAAQVMTYGWFGGGTFPWIQIAALVAWTAMLTPLAVKLFKWR